jgi:hypothetical protein
MRRLSLPGLGFYNDRGDHDPGTKWQEHVSIALSTTVLRLLLSDGYHQEYSVIPRSIRTHVAE